VGFVCVNTRGRLRFPSVPVEGSHILPNLCLLAIAAARATVDVISTARELVRDAAVQETAAHSEVLPWASARNPQVTFALGNADLIAISASAALCVEQGAINPDGPDSAVQPDGRLRRAAW
jgi:hypothetical protein